MIYEGVRPQRAHSHHQLRRWLNNVGVTGLNLVLGRYTGAIAAVAASMVAQRFDVGLLNHLHSGFWPQLMLALVLLDLSGWCFHWLSHKVPLLWRLHALHHTDTSLDFSTTYRHHPLDNLYTMVQAVLTVAVIGPSPLAAAVYAAASNGWNVIRHGNMRFPEWVERALRHVIVTPGMHCLHHSMKRRETDSNYGVILPWWDSLFGTRSHPQSAGTRATGGWVRELP